MYLWEHFLLGGMSLIFGVIFKLFPPRRINHIYGFKARTSIKTQEVWDESNRFVSILLMLFGSIILALGYIMPLLPIEVDLSVGIINIFGVLLLLSIFPLNQRHLISIFGKSNKAK